MKLEVRQKIADFHSIRETKVEIGVATSQHWYPQQGGFKIFLEKPNVIIGGLIFVEPYEVMGSVADRLVH